MLTELLVFVEEFRYECELAELVASCSTQGVDFGYVWLAGIGIDDTINDLTWSLRDFGVVGAC
jgi:hypothetical protein